jgi:NADH/NAD ratio-sensing transcriptional regulator Rex
MINQEVIRIMQLLLNTRGLQQMSSPMQRQQLEWRRTKVLEQMSKGEINQSEIARILQVDRSTICRDVDYLRQQAN